MKNPKEYIKKLLNCARFKKLCQFNAFENKEARKYLESRKLFEEDFKNLGIEVFFFEGVFNYKGKDLKIKKSVVIPLIDEGLIQGVWIRSIIDKEFFILTEFQKHWKCEFNEDVYIFESIFDAISFYKMTGIKSIMAILGVQLQNFEFLQDKNIKLCLDNDIAGIKASLNIIEKFKRDEYNFKTLEIVEVENNEKDLNEILVKGSKICYNVINNMKAIVRFKSYKL